MRSERGAGGLRDRLRTPGGALAAVVLLTAWAGIESGFVPWAPFYVLYAAATIALPLWLGTARLGSLRALRLRDWGLALGALVAVQVVALLLFGLLYPRILEAAGVGAEAESPFYSLPAALSLMFEQAGAGLGTPAESLERFYLLFILLWAGAGEELFYRGYLQEVWARRGLAVGVLGSAACFGVRHAAQLTLLAGDYPWAAAGVWVLYAFLFGLVMSFLYLRTRSLWPPIFVHYAVNLLAAATG